MKTDRPIIDEQILKEKVVSVNRCAKVVKGGRNFSFNAIVVVGDGNGRVGLALGKANEVTDAITKATESAKRSMVRVPIINGTIPYKIVARYGASKIVLKPASPGTGIIAGGPVRAICESAGIQNILAKSIGSRNPHNITKATLNALKDMLDLPKIMKLRRANAKEVLTGKKN